MTDDYDHNQWLLIHCASSVILLDYKSGGFLSSAVLDGCLTLLDEDDHCHPPKIFHVEETTNGNPLLNQIDTRAYVQATQHHQLDR